MAIYESACNTCGRIHEYAAKIADRDNTPICCNRPTVKQMTTCQVGAMVWTHAKGFIGPNGKWMGDGNTYKKWMKANDMVSESESKSMVAEAKKRRKIEHEKSVERTVEKIVTQAGQ
jgi:hypothetical protein